MCIPGSIVYFVLFHLYHSVATSPTPDQNSMRPPSEVMNVLQNMVGRGNQIDQLIKKNTGIKLACQRWYAMFVKRLLHSKRHKASIISQLVMPGIFTLLALCVVKTFPKETESPPRDVNVRMYKKTYAAYCANQK